MGSPAKTVADLAKAQDWALSPSGELVGDPAGSLALGMAPAAGINGREEAQSKAAARFRAIIEPIVNPERFPELHCQFPRREDLIQHLASEHGTSRSTIYRQLGKWQSGGITGLTRPIRSDKGIPRAVNIAGRNFIIAASLPKPECYGEQSCAEIWRMYKEERRWREAQTGKPLSRADRIKYAGCVDADGALLPSAQLSAASYDAVRDVVNRVPELIKLQARKGDEGYRNAELLSYRDIGATAPMDFCVMDHRLLDAVCMIRDRGGWRVGRPWLTAAIDYRSRKWLGWCLVETPSSDSIAAVLRKVFVNWGLPKALGWDNGKDFRAHWLEGRRERNRPSGRIGELPSKWAGVLETLGIRVHHAIVRRARSKIIEPCFGAIADFDRTLDEYTGHRPGARPERMGRLLEEHESWLAGKRPNPAFRTIEEMARLYSLAINDLNERPHRGEGMRKVTSTGMSWYCPNEIWEILIPHVERRTVPEDVLQLCFAKRCELMVRNGEVQRTLAGKVYHYRLSDRPKALLGLNGRKVELAYDDLDLGKAAVYAEGAFLGLADCVPLRHMGSADFVQDERNRRSVRREVKQIIQTLHRAVPVPDRETYLTRRAAVTAARVEPARIEAPAQLPQAIEAAAAAIAEERAFSFDAVQPIETIEPPADGAGDDEFNFFSNQGD